MMKTIFLVWIALTPLGILKAQDFQHVEPAFWWSGMNKSSVQVMFHGENMGDFEVKCADFVIEEVVRTENNNFLFVTLDTKNHPPGNYAISFFKGKKEKLKYQFELKQRRPESAYRDGFDASDVIYLLMPDRFANGDKSNDNSDVMKEKLNRSIKGGRHGGDISGITQHLDYLNDLGVTSIWSTPMLADDDSTYSYHTYAQSDVYQIDPRYGTNEEYKTLSDEMHKRNMKLIMDYVTNHWGSSHWMMEDMPTYSWFHQFPGYKQSNYRMTTQYDPYASKVDLKYCEEGWFVSTMPDLDQSNPLVLNYLIQNALWWIEYANLDGLRVDTYSYNDKAGIAAWTKAIMDEYPNFNIVGEVWLHDQAQISYWQKDSEIGGLQSFNSNCPSVMDFTLHDALGTVFHEAEANWFNGMIKIYENFVNDFLYPDPNNILVFLENHDTQRFNEIYADIEDYKLGMTLINTVRGIPQLYYGSEVGMKGSKELGDGDIRLDFPGGWAEDDQNAFEQSTRTERQESYHAFTKKLLNWRKNAHVIHTGKTMHFLPEGNVYVYFRYNDTEKVMVILNNSTEDQTLDLARFSEITEDKKSGVCVLSGQKIDLSAPKFTVKAKQALIFELN